MNVRIILVVMVGLILMTGQEAWAQESSNCYSSPGEPAGCINTNSGFTTCVPNGGTCTLGPECGIAIGCFMAGTLVETAAGCAAIEEIAVGDLVRSLSDDGSIVLAEVSRTYVTLSYEYFLINDTIKVTAEHPFRVADEWVDAGDLIVGDILLGYEGGEVAVGTITRIDRGVRAYNIEVEGTHTFFADGIPVHNKGPNPGG